MAKITYNEIIAFVKEEVIRLLAMNIDYISKRMVTNLMDNLNESTTPMMEIVKFRTNAEQIKDNTTLQDLLKFIRKYTKSGNLNFLINMAKDEHIEKLRQMNIPNPEATLGEIKEYLDSIDDNEILKHLKNGMYDSIESDIITNLKEIYLEDFKDSKNKITKDQNETMMENLNESESVSIYSPIGLKFEDLKNDKTYLLVESECLEYDNLNESYNHLTIDKFREVGVPESYITLMGAINQLPYDVDTDSFTPAMIWDFNTVIDNLGNITISSGDVLKTKDNQSFTISPKELRQLFTESLLRYKEQRNPNYNNYLKDADNVCLLCENHNKLVKFDTLKAIRNLNESSYCLIKQDLSEPTIIALNSRINKFGNQEFNTFRELNESLVQNLNINFNDTNKLFESCYQNEVEFEKANKTMIDKLYEQQSEINKDIQISKNMLAMAESDSPAFVRLNESLQILDRKLNMNIAEIKEHKSTTVYGKKRK
jgi:hypothetical protein|nr:MAG TPA: hypothetical protein [Caudoviricetes sp.]